MTLSFSKRLPILPAGFFALISLFIVLSGTWLFMPLFTGQPQFKDVSPNLQNAAPFVPDLGAPDLHAPNVDNPGTPMQGGGGSDSTSPAVPLQPSWDYGTLPTLPNQPFETQQPKVENNPVPSSQERVPSPPKQPVPEPTTPETPKTPGGVEIFPGITLSPQPPSPGKNK